MSLVDAAIADDPTFAHAWSELDATSLIAADGSSGPARQSDGKLGEPIRADWWFRNVSEFRKDPRFALYCNSPFSLFNHGLESGLIPDLKEETAEQKKDHL